jgi:hypothetical protein
LNIIRAALAVDLEDNNFDSLHDSWNKLGEEDAPSVFGAGKLDIAVTDLSGLLQVNAQIRIGISQVIQSTCVFRS